MPRRSAPPRESEAQFQRAVRELAQWCGYLTYHPLRSEKSTPGWPDWAFAKPGRPLLLVELKSARGVVAPAQREWQEVLRQTKGLRAEVWTPDMWGHVESILKHGMP